MIAETLERTVRAIAIEIMIGESIIAQGRASYIIKSRDKPERNRWNGFYDDRHRGKRIAISQSRYTAAMSMKSHSRGTNQDAQFGNSSKVRR